ncbi:hypothetical protein PVAP13_5NG397862 [Panicum virgatum]|uniref:Uncharacterized protein n=1 Tax=Panicum virgatum TaxID=38727 RepID=A0A8T0RWK9_PANVG|nr:hypothetical protein PVAP13_5NG397862 [Panicum virgatum]
MWHTLITCIAEPKSDSRKPAHAATGSARSRNTSGSAPNDTPTPQIAPLPPLTNTNPNSTASFIHRQTPPATIPARTHSQLQIIPLAGAPPLLRCGGYRSWRTGSPPA